MSVFLFRRGAINWGREEVKQWAEGGNGAADVDKTARKGNQQFYIHLMGAHCQEMG